MGRRDRDRDLDRGRDRYRPREGRRREREPGDRDYSRRDDERRRRRERDSGRDRDRDRGRSSRQKEDRSRRRERSASPPNTSKRVRRRDRRTVAAPRVPPAFFCHICGKNHWTAECPRLKANPKDYPLLSRTRSCWKCAQRGHDRAQCTVKRYKCHDCGGIHDTRDCIYNHKSEEFHEFFDAATKHVYYVSAVDGSTQWNPPTHKLDTILWFCAHCQLLIPHKYQECLVCHAARPQSEVAATETDSKSSSDSDQDDDIRNVSSESDYSGI